MLASSHAALSLAEASRVLALPAERLEQLIQREQLAPAEFRHGDFQFRREDVERLKTTCHSGTHHHAVQFFDNEDFLCDVVVKYLVDGLKADAPMVVIARPERLKMFVEQLDRDGHAGQACVDRGQLQLFDAHEALAQFIVDGMPEPRKFRELVGPVIERGRAAYPHARLRAYGEMVDILWSQGNPQAAIRLEELWNELAGVHPFSLLCGYWMSNFKGQNDDTLFEHVCETHSDVSPTEHCLHPGKLDAHRREVARMQQRIHSLEAQLPPAPPAANSAPSAMRRAESRPVQRGSTFDATGISILVVDDDSASRRLILETLGEVRRPTLRLSEASSVAQGLARIEAEHPDLCICDFRLSDRETALDLYRAARARGSAVPFVGVTGNLLEEDLAETLLTAGFEDVVLKRELDQVSLHRIVRNAALRGQSTRKLIEIGTVDEMTGVLNRRGYLVRLETERRRCERAKQTISVLYLDLNRLKRVNDQYGHRAGDQMIKTLVANLRPLLRSCDAVGRLGGDEFCVVLPQSCVEVAQNVAQRLRERLAESPIPIGSEMVTLSVSIGIHSAAAADIASEELIDKADTAMFVDKQRCRAAEAAAQSM